MAKRHSRSIAPTNLLLRENSKTLLDPHLGISQDGSNRVAAIRSCSQVAALWRGNSYGSYLARIYHTGHGTILLFPRFYLFSRDIKLGN